MTLPALVFRGEARHYNVDTRLPGGVAFNGQQGSSMSEMLQKLDTAARKAPVVPVIVVDDAKQAAPLARALVRAGITIAEVTLRTPAGLAAISAMKVEAPELLVGAGTVLNGKDVDDALKAGAEFLVSPGMSPDLRAALKGQESVMIPGIATASEAMARHEEGFARLKLFPASIAGGAPALKALAGPLPHLKFMPTGGISEDQVKTYLSLPNVFALGGSWIASQADIASGNWTRIEEIARRLLALA